MDRSVPVTLIYVVLLVWEHNWPHIIRV